MGAAPSAGKAPAVLRLLSATLGTSRLSGGAWRLFVAALQTLPISCNASLATAATSRKGRPVPHHSAAPATSKVFKA